jgi:hypothetical protein
MRSFPQSEFYFHSEIWHTVPCNKLYSLSKNLYVTKTNYFLKKYRIHIVKTNYFLAEHIFIILKTPIIPLSLSITAP